MVRLASGMGSVAAPDPSGDNGLSAEGESVASALISGVASLPFSMTKAKERSYKIQHFFPHERGKDLPVKKRTGSRLGVGTSVQGAAVGVGGYGGRAEGRSAR